MRRVTPPARPRGWQTNVLQAGRRWLRDPRHRHAQRPRDLWLRYRDQIGEAFAHLCCYSAIYVPNGEADHFTPWSALRGTRQAHQAYQWSNIRYADGWINRSKGAEAFPDPFLVQDDWFVLHLPSLELRATGRHPHTQDQAVQNLLRRVCDDPRIMKIRRHYFRTYRQQECTLTHIDRCCPLLGRALRDNPTWLTATDQARLHAGTLPPL
jgi:hypothetical protein